MDESDLKFNSKFEIIQLDFKEYKPPTGQVNSNWRIFKHKRASLFIASGPDLESETFVLFKTHWERMSGSDIANGFYFKIKDLNDLYLFINMLHPTLNS